MPFAVRCTKNWETAMPLNRHLTVTVRGTEDASSSARATGTFGQPEFAGGFKPEMPVDHLTVATGQHRNLEPELADAGAHAIHDRVVLAWVPSVEDEPVYGPNLDLSLSRRFLRWHTSPRFGEESSAGCARGAGPAN
jgi:hypothetical protein